MNNPNHIGRKFSLAYRYKKDKLFRFYGLLASIIGLIFLLIFFSNLIGKGKGAFFQTQIKLNIDFSQEVIDPNRAGDKEEFLKANYGGILKDALLKRFPSVSGRKDTRSLKKIIGQGGIYKLSDLIQERPEWVGTSQEIWMIASDDIDMYIKGKISTDVPDDMRRVNDKQIEWIKQLEQSGQLRTAFNAMFFTSADSREPEMAGILGAVMGTALTLLITLALSFPVGVMAAIYLEELSKKSRFTDFIEININNLAAVPSIVFGLLGLAVFLNVFHMPRSAPVVGGCVLALMTLPTVIIATRSSLRAVPPSIREAARALGASNLQVVMHHVLPLAMPGVFTGTIIGMSRALGESAPLLMIGMVAFIVDIPVSFDDPATALPVQIYLWADSPEKAFVEKTAAGTLILLLFLILMNSLAVILRKKYEKKW